MKLNRHSILLLAGCMVILAVLAGLILLEPREPRYQGRSLSNWLEDVSSTRYLQESESKLQLAAMRTLKTLGHKARPAIPALEQQLKTLDEQIGLAAADALLSVDVHNVPAIVYRMHHGETGERTGAYWMLPREEPDAQKAMPEIMRGLDDGDPEIRRAALEGLAKYGSPARSALPALTNLLSDQKRFVRLAASNAVGTIVNSVRPDAVP